MSHDPLLDDFRTVRMLLTAFKDTLRDQKRFTVETAGAFSDEDRRFWDMQQEHERRKHSGVDPALRDALRTMLAAKIERWSHLCALARSGAEVDGDLIES